MKSAILSTFSYGGAGKAALRLNKALNLVGEENTIFVKKKKLDQSQILDIASKEVHSRLIDDFMAPTFYKNLYHGNTLSSFTYPSIGFEFLDCLEPYDLINIHWINDFLSVEAICKIETMNKPIVWTLHDQNSFTGTCHYCHGCDKYMLDCDSCPQLIDDKFNLSKCILETKLKYLPKDIVIVCPSDWMANCAKKSSLFRNNKIEVIANSIETDVYIPYDKNECKKELDLPKNGKVILLGAWDLYEKRKGTSLFIESFEYLKQDEYIQDLIKNGLLTLMTFGEGTSILGELQSICKPIGSISDDVLMAKIYSAADVFILPSLEDNLPNTMVESLSCGTPVVSFKVGGMNDTIIHGETGYLSELYDTKGMSENIVVALKGESLSDNCRKYAEKYFNPEVQGNKYKALFQDILRNFTPKNDINPHIPIIFPEMAQAIAEPLLKASILEHEDTERIIFERNKLQPEYEQLQQTLFTTDGERNYLKQYSDNLNQAVDFLKEKIDNLQIDYDKLVEYHNNLVNEKQNAIEYLESLNSASTIQNEFLSTENISITQEKVILEQEKAMLEQKKAMLEQEKVMLEQKKAMLEEKIDKILNSTSWKITKPLRSLILFSKKLLNFVCYIY